MKTQASKPLQSSEFFSAMKRIAVVALVALGLGIGSAYAALPAVKCNATKGSYYSCVNITWSRASGAKYYRIYRGTSPYASKCYWIKNVGANTTSVWDYTASPAVRYYYFVLPVDSNGTGYYNASYYGEGYTAANGIVQQSATTIGVGKDCRLYMSINGTRVKPTNVSVVAGSNSGKVYVYNSLNSSGSFGYVRGYKEGDIYIRVTYYTQSALIKVTTKSTLTMSPKSAIGLNSGKVGLVIYCDGRPIMPTYQYTVGTTVSLTRYGSLTSGGSLGYLTPKSIGETTFVFTYYGNTIYCTVKVIDDSSSGLELYTSSPSVSVGSEVALRLTYNGTSIKPTSGTIKYGTNVLSFGAGSVNMSVPYAKINIYSALQSNGAFGKITGLSAGSISLTLNYNGQSITKNITVK